MRKLKRVRIRGPLIKGQRVLRQAPSGDGPWPKRFRYYNPNGEDFDLEVERNMWIELRARDGEIEILEIGKAKPRADLPKKPPKPDEKGADR